MCRDHHSWTSFAQETTLSRVTTTSETSIVPSRSQAVVHVTDAGNILADDPLFPMCRNLFEETHWLQNASSLVQLDTPAPELSRTIQYSPIQIKLPWSSVIVSLWVNYLFCTSRIQYIWRLLGNLAWGWSQTMLFVTDGLSLQTYNTIYFIYVADSW